MKVLVAPYNPKWKEMFLAEKKALETIINSKEIQIEHIGSTSIKDMPAKPIIDILVGVPSKAFLSEIVERLLSNNAYIYIQIYEQNIDFRRFFAKLNTDKRANIPATIDFPFDEALIPLEIRSCHIHVVPIDHEFWSVHIKFREILKANPSIRAEYQILKLNLSMKDWGNSKEYYYSKHEFIKAVLDKY